MKYEDRWLVVAMQKLEVQDVDDLLIQLAQINHIR